MSTSLRPLAAPLSPPNAAARPPASLFGQYELDRAFDEMFDAPARARPQYQALVDELAAVSLDDMRRRQIEADRAFLTQGITFTVYGDAQGTERIFPFDLLPRIVTAREWDTLEPAGGAAAGIRRRRLPLRDRCARRRGIPAVDGQADDRPHGWHVGERTGIILRFCQTAR